MPDIPRISYARSGDVHIAYQTWGRGPRVVGVPPFVQNIEQLWSDPSGCYPYFLERFGRFATVTQFDKRGTGLSDRVDGANGIEERMDDIRAVMDAAGVVRATIGGISEGGPMAMLFAATYPERTEKLLLAGTAARFVTGPDYPHGTSPELFDSFTEQVVARWATPESLLTPMWMPTMTGNTAFMRWIPTYERACASPGAVREIFRFVRDIDVRSVLSSIQAPTLIIHRTDDRVVPVAHGRYLAEHIPNATLVELPGNDHVPWIGDVDAVLAAIEEFVTGTTSARADVDRVLATVLFTDIVGATERATRLGDARWRALLDRHDAAVREQLARHGGREVKTTGDGFLATFDSPSRAVRAAAAIVDATRAIGVQVRAGLHTGEVERRGDDVAGLAVHVGARVAAFADADEVVVSSTVRDLVLGAGFAFDDRGTHRLKGIDGEWRLLALRR